MDDESLVDLRCSVVVTHRDQFLLVNRGGSAGVWVLPGGRPRTGESMRSCARREAFEEMGEPGSTPNWVSSNRLSGLRLRPPTAGYLPALLRGQRNMAAYLGNLWRPSAGDGPPADTS